MPPFRTQDRRLEADGRFGKDYGLGRRVVALDGLAERRVMHCGVRVGFDAYSAYFENRYSTVVLGGNLAREDGEMLRRKAIGLGAPKDTYLWTFPKKMDDLSRNGLTQRARRLAAYQWGGSK